MEAPFLGHFPHTYVIALVSVARCWPKIHWSFCLAYVYGGGDTSEHLNKISVLTYSVLINLIYSDRVEGKQPSFLYCSSQNL